METGRLIRDHGVNFASVGVKPHVLNNASEAAETIAGADAGLPMVLMAQDSRGQPTYYGHRDPPAFTARVRNNVIPWRHYTIS
jgi:hypothetical protein